jgi:hypothetical protein
MVLLLQKRREDLNAKTVFSEFASFQKDLSSLKIHKCGGDGRGRGGERGTEKDPLGVFPGKKIPPNLGQ